MGGRVPPSGPLEGDFETRFNPEKSRGILAVRLGYLHLILGAAESGGGHSRNPPVYGNAFRAAVCGRIFFGGTQKVIHGLFALLQGCLKADSAVGGKLLAGSLSFEVIVV